MYKKTQIVLITVIFALLVIIPVGFLIMSFNNDTEDIADTDNSSIFQSVSNLDALNLGLIDGDELRQENGIEEKSTGENTISEPEDIAVYISLRSIRDDLKIKLLNASSDKLIPDVNFTVTVKSSNKTMDYTDSDKDGIIYIPYVEAGDYTVFLSDITSDNKNYHADKSQTITVSDSIEYAKVDIKDEIKDESQINVAEEDTKVQDADQTTDISVSTDKGNSQAETAPATELQEDDLSEDAEDLLAQIEAETAAAENSKSDYKGAEGGTITAPAPATAPAIASDPQYIAAHSGSKGIDVSKHNGTIDWNAVKNDGISFAIIRCGYRGSSSGALVIDPLYYTNMAGAQSAGISTGVYFFTQAVNEAEAVEEASMVLELLNGYSLQMPVYLDVEKSNGRGDAISVEDRNAVCRAFLSTIKNAGYTTGIYSNKLWFENRISTASFLDNQIWLAQYVDIPTYGATRYDMWQYTSKGHVAGISGNVDMNVLK